MSSLKCVSIKNKDIFVKKKKKNMVIIKNFYFPLQKCLRLNESLRIMRCPEDNIGNTCVLL